MLSEEIRAFIQKHEEDDIHQLLLSSQTLEGDALKFAVQQIAGRQYAKSKLPSWYENQHVCYPVHLSLEQCSSELTAVYKSKLITGDSLVDLTGGFGVDTTCLASQFKQVIYVEQNQELAQIAQANFKAFQLNHIQVWQRNALDALAEIKQVETIFIDPARRSKSGGKLVSIADCEPNILQLQDLFRRKAQRVLIKMSPMLDIKQALRELYCVTDVHVVAVDNECKELLFLVDYSKEKDCNTNLYAVNLKERKKADVFSFTRKQEDFAPVTYTSTVKKYFYEPNVALLKAGVFNLITAKYAVDKLHPNSHVYTSDLKVDNFPGRRFQVEFVCKLDKKSIRELRKRVPAANLTIRNFPSSVAALRKKLKIGEGGSVYLFATTLYSEEKVLVVCSKI